MKPLCFSSLQTVCDAHQANLRADRERPHQHRPGLVSHADAELPGAVLQPVVHPPSGTDVVLYLPPGGWR